MKDTCFSHPLYCVSVCIFRQLPGSKKDSVFIGIVWTPQLEKPFLNPCCSTGTHTYTLISYHLSGQGRVCVLSASNEEQRRQLFLVWKTLIKLTTLCPLLVQRTCIKLNKEYLPTPSIKGWYHYTFQQILTQGAYWKKWYKIQFRLIKFFCIYK